MSVNVSYRYANQCDDIEPAVGVALGACRRVLQLRDLKWLPYELKLVFEEDHMVEHALAIGAQMKYEECGDVRRGVSVDWFLKAAAYLFWRRPTPKVVLHHHDPRPANDPRQPETP